MKTTLLLLCCYLLTSVSYGQGCRLASGGGIPAPIAQMIADAEAQGTTGPLARINLYFHGYSGPSTNYQAVAGVHDIESVINLSEDPTGTPDSPHIQGGYVYPNPYSTNAYPIEWDDYNVGTLYIYISFTGDSIRYGLYGVSNSGLCDCTITREQFFNYPNNWSLTGYKATFKSADDTFPPPLWAPECLPDEPDPCTTTATITIQQPPKPE